MRSGRVRTARGRAGIWLLWAAGALAGLAGAGLAGQDDSAPQPGPPTAAPPTTAQTPDTGDTWDDPVEVVLYLTDGQRIAGELVSDAPERVIIKIGEIATEFPRPLVDRMERQPTVLERYRLNRRAIEDTDSERLLLLSEWLARRGKHATALKEIDGVLAREPGNPNAARLRVFVAEQQRLAQAARERNEPGVEADAGSEPRERPRPRQFPLLNEDEINLLRIYEMDLTHPTRLAIPRETILRLMELHKGDPLIPTTAQGREDFLRQPPSRILDVMFKLQARDLYPQVRVLEHPRPIALFRENVHRAWLINACATSQCHGGEEAGRLMLYNRRPSSDAAVYTNLLILDRYRLRDGTPLIDYDNPARSALLQMGLPRADSLMPHPETPESGRRGWRPVFRSTSDVRYRQALAWIEGMYRPRPEYPIEYQVPVPRGLEGAAEGVGGAAPAEPGRPPAPRPR